MRPYPSSSSRLLVLLVTAMLSACGGSAGGAPTAASESRTLTTVEAPVAPSTLTPTAAPADSLVTSPIATPPPTLTTPPPTPTPTPTPPQTDATVVVAGANVVTDIRFQNTAAGAQVNVPVTFGQVFAPGHVAASQTVTGRLADGATVPLQVEVKARHADGSARHAIISTVLPSLAAGQTLALALATVPATAAPAPTSPRALLDAGFTAAVNLDLGGVRYSASADALLRSGQYKTWLSGPFANEWLVSVPFTTAQGTPHPHLMARFAIRADGAAHARVDVTVENGWAYEPAPQNFTYDVQVVVGPDTVYSKSAMLHYNHARWRKLFWWGTPAQVHVRHNIGYLIASQAVANYDRASTFSETTLAAMKTGWTGAKTEPMGVGLANPYMPSTGGRPDIGLLPGWAATYLLTMDPRAKEVTMGTADLSGSWSSHYRDKNTDRPVSLVDYPYMSVHGREPDSYNPTLKRSEWFPACATGADCNRINIHDAAHQPNLVYLPYLVTGDYYYLEELQFWGMWNSFMSNPAYREYGKALLKADEVRGQAWGFRSLVEAAYITPDADPLKAHFARFVDSNLDWYNAEYTNNPAANKLGVLINGYAFAYNNGTGIAPWQDDFFTSAVGHAVELGFEKAKPLLAYKTTFPVARMSAAGACWIDAAIYTLKLRSSATSPIFASMGEAYAASHTDAFNLLECAGTAMATALNLKVGEMTGYARSEAGYPSNMQPAIAYAAGAGGAQGLAAWTMFSNRTVKPNYGVGPQFSIVPR